MYIRSISFKVLFRKQPHIYINDAIKHKNIKSIKYYGISRRYKWSMPYCRKFMRFVIRSKCHVRWLRFHFKRMLIKVESSDGWSIYNSLI